MIKHIDDIRQSLINLNKAKNNCLFKEELLYALDSANDTILQHDVVVIRLLSELEHIKKDDVALVKEKLKKLHDLYRAYVWLLDDLDLIVQETFANYTIESHNNDV